MKTIKELEKEIEGSIVSNTKLQHGYLQALKDVLKLIDEWCEEYGIKKEGSPNIAYDKLKQKIKGAEKDENK